jgi:hypothetical protein
MPEFEFMPDVLDMPEFEAMRGALATLGTLAILDGADAGADTGADPEFEAIDPDVVVPPNPSALAALLKSPLILSYLLIFRTASTVFTR